MKKIKVALIGFNRYSHAIPVYIGIKKLNDIFRVAGYVLPENEKDRFSDIIDVLDGLPELTLDEVMNDSSIEAVIIDTEEIHLTKYAIIAASHGKAIHMEKPGGTSLCDFERLIEIVKSNNLVFHIAYMYRYNPYIMKVMEQIKNGELGEILSVEAQMNCIHTKEVRQWLKGFPGGMMFFLGCHLIDLILQIKGIPDNIIPLNRSTGIDGITSEDFGMAVLEYKNGISFAKTSALEYGGFARRQLVITGSKKTIEIKPLEMFTAHPSGTELYSGVTEYSSNEWKDMGQSISTEPYDRYKTMLQSFGKMVRGEMENPYTYDYELELYKAILKACGR